MKIHKIIIGINRPGQTTGTLYTGDLIYQNGQPVLVLEWNGPPGEAAPSVAVILDPAKMQDAPQGYQANYIYQVAIDDPRPMQ